MTFGVGNECYLAYSSALFYGSNYGKLVGSLIDKPPGKLVDLYLIYLRLAETLMLRLKEVIVDTLLVCQAVILAEKVNVVMM